MLKEIEAVAAANYSAYSYAASVVIFKLCVFMGVIFSIYHAFLMVYYLLYGFFVKEYSTSECIRSYFVNTCIFAFAFVAASCVLYLLLCYTPVGHFFGYMLLRKIGLM